MSGGADNPDRDFICQSDPRSDCVITASRPNAQVFGHVHVYYHPVATETKYAGAIQIGFFDVGGSSATLTANMTRKPKDAIGNQSVTGIVTSKTGTFPVSFDLTATSVGNAQVQFIRTEIPVVIR